MQQQIAMQQETTKIVSEPFFSFMDKYFLSQYIEEPTRINNTLELALSNDINLVKQVITEDTDLSDHKLITVKSHFGVKQNSASVPTFKPHTFRSLNFYKADLPKLKEHLKNIQWDDLKLLCDPHDFPELVRLIILQVSELYAPTKCNRSKTNRLSVYRRERRSLNRKKRKLQRKLVDTSLNPIQIQNIKEKIVNTQDQIKDYKE
jgi:hypothetical protein